MAGDTARRNARFPGPLEGPLEGRGTRPKGHEAACEEATCEEARPVTAEDRRRPSRGPPRQRTRGWSASTRPLALGHGLTPPAGGLCGGYVC